jgi:hypothetical protein
MKTCYLSGIKLFKILFKFLNCLPESGVTLLLSNVRLTFFALLSQVFCKADLPIKFDLDKVKNSQ